MLIRIDQIKDAGLELTFTEAAATFPVLAAMEDAGECSFQGPVSVRIRALRAHEMVEVEGNLDTVVKLACDRCLQAFSEPISVSFELTYTQEMPTVEDETGEEGVELSADDLGLILFSGDEFDLREQVQEQLIMALPVQALCRPDCRGLCPHCGVDLNSSSCNCAVPEFNNRFGALKNFKVEK